MKRSLIALCHDDGDLGRRGRITGDVAARPFGTTMRMLGLAAVVLVGAVACGDSDDDTSEATTNTEGSDETATESTSTENPDNTVVTETTVGADSSGGWGLSYPVSDTGQTAFYDGRTEIDEPAPGDTFYGQDANHDGIQPSYTDNGDGTVTDDVTGLVWQQTADTDGDGDIDASDKLSVEAATSYCESLSLGGSDAWEVPTIKQLFSLIQFTGIDPSGYESDDTSALSPFIDTDVFEFSYGDTTADERTIDAQYVTTTSYVSDVDGELLFGVNFADGRIKGYETSLPVREMTFNVMCVQANDTYGVNDFTDNGDGTITDAATGLMWSQDDSGAEHPDGYDWKGALEHVEELNESNYLGYSDWRLPNIKELQSIVDYTRSPDTTDSAAIDPLFNSTPIINEEGETDYTYYWSGTTHPTWSADNDGFGASYVNFGRGLGYLDGQWQDVHGAGAQRSDPKTGDPDNYPTGNGPQGDAIRIYNYIRVVRNT